MISFFSRGNAIAQNRSRVSPDLGHGQQRRGGKARLQPPTCFPPERRSCPASNDHPASFRNPRALPPRFLAADSDRRETTDRSPLASRPDPFARRACMRSPRDSGRGAPTPGACQNRHAGYRDVTRRASPRCKTEAASLRSSCRPRPVTTRLWRYSCRATVPRARRPETFPGRCHSRQ